MGRWQTPKAADGGVNLPRPKQPRNVAKARQLRKTLSLPEVLLWRHLKGGPEGIKFRKQHPIGRYFLDFYVAKQKLAIEIDGIAHDMGDRPERDETRDAFLRNEGIEVVRIPATEVLKSPVDVAEMLVRYRSAKTPPSDA
jgi:very-short-patch-repair endonuclease